MEFCGTPITPVLLSRAGLVFGIVGSLLLAFSAKIGTVSKGGQIIFNGLDPMELAEKNKKKVLNSHWRNRYLSPTGWGMLVISFCLQFASTFDI